MRRGAGRPSACTPKLIEQICDALVASNGSLTTLLTRRRTFPGASTLWRWCASDDAIREQISRAKECQAERMQGDTFEKLHDVIADAHDRMAAGTAVDSQLLGVLARRMLADRAAQSDCLDGVPPATPLPAQASSG
jgi:predicted trehalose synthase